MYEASFFFIYGLGIRLHSCRGILGVMQIDRLSMVGGMAKELRVSAGRGIMG